MDSINITSLKMKANAIKKHRQLQKVASLFRVVEVCIFLALLSRFSVQIPVSFKSYCEYFRGLTIVLSSPCFVFILGNAIVITLFAKSGRFSDQHSIIRNLSTDIYKEFVEESEKRQNSVENRVEKQGSHVEYIKTEDIYSVSLETKNYKRCQSEKIKRAGCKNKSCRELRRMATEKCIGILNSHQTQSDEILYPEDGMSNEEFKSTIEAFIERQKKFHIDEENAFF